MTDDQLQFIDYRKPKLEAGKYTFTVDHDFGGPKSDQKLKESTEVNLLVAGTRVSVGDEAIFARYPPSGETGDFSDTLPHISFNQGTLPWIRSAYDHEQASSTKENYEPWIYLMNVHDGDVQQGLATAVVPCAIKDLRSGDAYFPKGQYDSLMADISLKEGDSEVADRVVQTITIKKSFFNTLLWQDKSQNNYLSHVRRRWQATNDANEYFDAAALNELDKQFYPGNGSAEAPKKGEDSRVELTDYLRENLHLPDSAVKIDQLARKSSWLVNDPEKGDLLLDLIDGDDGKNRLKVSSLKRELSVLMSNRFAQSDSTIFPEGTRNNCYVVSLEGYLKEENREEIDSLNDGDMMRIVVLTSWWFNCTEEKVNFEQRSKALDVDSLRMPKNKISPLMGTSNECFIDRLNAGYVALPHRFRQGDQSISWYRGPLVPNEVVPINQIALNDNELALEKNEQIATDADRLLCYFDADGMFDISYSSAYELGRMLSFKNNKYCKALSQYKRAKARYIELKLTDDERRKAVGETGIYIENLPYAKLIPEAADAQLKMIKSWLVKLVSFESIPRWNLIAEPDLLPERALRTFNVDPKWVQSLWLGALSLNGRPKITAELFKELYNDTSMQEQIPQYGAILRSDIVWAYPELQAKFRNLSDAEVTAEINLEGFKAKEKEGYADFIESFKEKKIMYKQRLDRESFLYLTKEGFDYVSLSLPPESLHYGANFNNSATAPVFTKSIKLSGKTVIDNLAVPMRDKSLAVIDMTELASDIVTELKACRNTDVNSEFKKSLDSQGFNSARMSRFMLEGEAQVEFTVGDEMKSGDDQ